MEATIRARIHGQVNFFVAYLDYERLDDAEYRKSMAETFRHGYDEKPDLIIPFAYQALRFVAEYRAKIFPGVPIVFSFVAANRLQGQKMWPGVTGVTTPIAIGETIDLALRLHPDTKMVAVISADQQFWWTVTHNELLRHRDHVQEIDIIGEPDSRMIDQIASLPPHTIALFQLAAQDSNHPAVDAHDVFVVTTRRVPTYGAWKSVVDQGAIGGVYSDALKQAQMTGEMAARVLAGEKPESIPVVEDRDLQVRVNSQQLRRWNIPESALPAGSVLLNRQPTVWERHRDLIITISIVLIAQAILIAALLWQRARKRKAEAVLRESENRFRVMADTTPTLVWMSDAKGKITYINDRWISLTGALPETGFGDSWTRFVHPDDLSEVQTLFSHALMTHKSFSNECRLRRTDGNYRWIFDVASPRVNGDGSFAGFIGSAIDTTDQKLAQEALERVSGQLIEAQERERSRIARELHDDICQRLALLSMELDQANSNTNEPPAMSLGDIQKHCVEIANDVQSLSHQLHSSTLDYLGIVSAVRGFCEELSRQHKINIAFREKNVPKHLPKDISLCLFRVAQEALHNAVKYSGTNQFTVEIYGTFDEIHLAVTDRGVGFQVESAKGHGLGLISMYERVHLVHGTFSIDSKPGEGTKVVAVVPLLRVKHGVPKDEDVESHHG
jgi:PAS domain S-box-containing protein